GGETGAHARPQHLLAGIGLEHDLAGHHIDELILARVPVATRRLPARYDAGEVDAEIAEPGMLAQATIPALLVRLPEHFRIGGRIRFRHGERIEPLPGRRHARPPRFCAALWGQPIPTAAM